MKRSLLLLLCALLVTVLLCACGNEEGPRYANTWSSDDTHHWHAAINGDETDKGDYTPHVDETNDGICEVCEKEFCFHPLADEDDWSSDATNHWHAYTCTHSIPLADAEAHTDKNFDGLCDTCNYQMYRVYTITVKAEDYIDIAGDLKVKEGEDASLTITIHKSVVIDEVTGATLVGEPLQAGEYFIYTYEIKALTADATIEIKSRKTSAVKVVAEGTGVIENITGYLNYFGGTLDLNITTPGTYLIYSFIDDNYLPVWFGPMTGKLSDTEQYYTFDVTEEDIEDGIFTVKTSCFPFETLESGKNPYSYAVVQVEKEVILPNLKDTGYTMPTNVEVSVEVTIPTPGIYQFSSLVPGITLNDEITNCIVFETTEANQVCSFTVKLQDATKKTFEFDWSITPFTPEKLTLGTNTLNLEAGKFYAFSYTVETIGVHKFDLKWSGVTARVYLWNGYMAFEDYDYITANTAVGTTIVFYVQLELPEESTLTGPQEGTITTSHLYYAASDNKDGTYKTATSETGLLNQFVYEGEKGELVLTAPADTDVEISVDNGETWHKSVTMNLLYGANVKFLVRSATITHADVSVETFIYKAELEMGKTSELTLIPGKEYTLSLTGFEAPTDKKQFYLYFTDANIQISFASGKVVASGELNKNFSPDSTLTLKYLGEGTEAVTVSIRAEEDIKTYMYGDINLLQAGTSQTLKINPNSSSDTEKTNTFSGTTTGNIVLTITFNKWLRGSGTITYIIGDGEPVTVNNTTKTTIEISLAAGETITIVAVSDAGAGTSIIASFEEATSV